MPAWAGSVSRVSASRSRAMSSGSLPFATTYACSSSVRGSVFADMRPTLADPPEARDLHVDFVQKAPKQRQ